MPLNNDHIQILREIDAKARALLETGGEEALLEGLQELMLLFKPVLDAGSERELERMAEVFPDFGWFAALLSDFSAAIADGVFDADLGRK